MYQIVVPKQFAPRDLVHVYEYGEKTVLPPWDPMVRQIIFHLQSLMSYFARVPWHEVYNFFDYLACGLHLLP